MIIVEDDPKLQLMLKTYFDKENFNTFVVSDGIAASKVVLENNPDIVLLDLMLPGQDGLTICRQIRNQYHGKILMLTASDDDFDHVAALEIGADDFVTKPIKPRVLLARVRMLLRRSEAVMSNSNTNILQFGSLILNKSKRRCEYIDQEIAMTDSEFDLLWLLASSNEEVLSRDVLTRALRGIEYNGVDRSIDNRIVNLRKKLGDDAIPPRKIVTVRGKGYLFIPEAWD
ncbi:DNA-binding response regulator in two-component regulatory system with RstB [Vibrio nigripulchritudo SFn27]|nr:DNA-binding response regulator in two-component regulatory system with RstB [Vibrio nigripulchritudo AM115]CCN45009.1 DNA-binding response regulator in two-component regulatory system with RstB [Vibrio nigripulchritudo FTn2]CCN79767.1 DNA-binding response regulator in two-component regulatory system with RstB [Vibrio nigripulchritudo SO65]CCN91991.1 DNA-binding response regulator in two-component regulatory system with RstB [Vibrio nigripulchritudo SFn27]